jgi:hypothetical protein
MSPHWTERTVRPGHVEHRTRVEALVIWEDAVRGVPPLVAKGTPAWVREARRSPSRLFASGPRAGGAIIGTGGCSGRIG